MRGLAKGEACVSTNPVLQLFTRQGELLTDPVAGTFKIDEVLQPGGSVVSKVASTPLDLTDAPAGHRLGPGRFFIPTGDTSSWNLGTHRVTCTYQMEAAGRTYVQVIYFEMLDNARYASGQSYVGYATTFDLYDAGFFAFSAAAPETLHPHIERESKRVENLTDRYFEPRYRVYKLDGNQSQALFIEEAIIAVEKVEAVSRSPNSSSASVELYDSDGYRVFNRHLDGVLNPDDRYNPKITVVESHEILGVSGYGGDFTWPFGRQNIQVTGCFGFTDPDYDGDGTTIGTTPKELVQVIGTLVTRFLANNDLSDLSTWNPGMVRSYKTRDQAISFYGASGSVSYTGGLTGDAMLDQLLQRFVKPARLSYPERKEARSIF